MASSRDGGGGLTESDERRDRGGQRAAGRGDAGPEPTESRSGVRTARVGDVLRDAVDLYAGSPELANAVVEAALARAGMQTIPVEPARLRAFIALALTAEVEARFGAPAAEDLGAALVPILKLLELRAGPERDAPAAGDPSPAAAPTETAAAPMAVVPAVVYVLADRPAISARVRMLLGSRAEVIRARSLEEVVRASVRRVGWRSAVLIDLRPGCVLEMPAAETLVRVIGRMPVVVWGDEHSIAELRWRAGRGERITDCDPNARPEDVALALGLQLDAT
jgi:hypothetical protein